MVQLKPDTTRFSSLQHSPEELLQMKLRMQRLLIAVLTLILGSGAVACATLGANSGPAEMSDLRRAVIARAQVWNRTPIRAMDLKAGPALKGAFQIGRASCRERG